MKRYVSGQLLVEYTMQKEAVVFCQLQIGSKESRRRCFYLIACKALGLSAILVHFKTNKSAKEM